MTQLHTLEFEEPVLGQLVSTQCTHNLGTANMAQVTLLPLATGVGSYSRPAWRRAHTYTLLPRPLCACARSLVPHACCILQRPGAPSRAVSLCPAGISRPYALCLHSSYGLSVLLCQPGGKCELDPTAAFCCAAWYQGLTFTFCIS